MICAATIDGALDPRHCARPGTRQVGPVHLCWQHAEDIEALYRRELGVDQMRSETDLLWDALRKELIDWEFDRKSVEFDGPCVYLAECRHMPGRVKIGFTTNLQERMRALEAIALAAVPGDQNLERVLHRQFAHLRVNRGREWFLADPSIVTAFHAAS